MLNDEEVKEAFENTLNGSKYAAVLLRHFIEKSGCFRQGLAKDDRTEIYNRGYGDFGLYIRDLFLRYAPDVYIKNIKEGVNKNDN